MSDPEKNEVPETLEQASKWVVDLFDQANTGAAIENMGSRGQELSRAVDDLRNVLNRDQKTTILDQGQMDEVRADREKIRQELADYEKGKEKQ